MVENQTKIDPEKFAYQFMNSLQHNGEKVEMEKAAKESLAAYLTAYYLAQRFNHLENTFFEEDHQRPISAYQRILSELNQY
ncbi:hypothetical protein IV487_00960 [Enterococcus saccharolyticus]|uniref:DUF3144 domain-containing protein n=1 Tax=Candidatus Enterococcus willemsii TaxID=1857215 RepID=A0ABQ6Z1P1_9ENTE|nr:MULTISPECIES: hypothetical protein [Enterococcus]KAF1305401.1 hypothetical protein BAU17_02610 [Enterococcus sp. CU12B]MCD5001046.1 hypothetical protein [Enterococcus saccharolyticus]